MQQKTVTDLPELNQEYPLSPEQIEGFQKDGHILLKGVASTEELSAFRPFFLDAVAKHNVEKRPLHERDTYGKAFLQIMNLWQKDEAIRRYVLARRFAKLAADLMQVDGVRLYHDQALFKEPGGGHTPWHQDQVYWPLDTQNTITLWMPLVDIPAEVGSMTFASGSHKHGMITKEVISDKSQNLYKQYIAERNLSTTTYGAMQAGDATFHAGWNLHSAPGNPTNSTREVMTIIYFADNTRVLEPDSQARRNDLKTWLPGIEPGELAASPLNPLLYARGRD